MWNRLRPAPYAVVLFLIGLTVSAPKSVGWVESSRPTGPARGSVGLEDSTHPTTTDRTPSTGSGISPELLSGGNANVQSQEEARECRTLRWPAQRGRTRRRPGGGDDRARSRPLSRRG